MVKPPGVNIANIHGWAHADMLNAIKNLDVVCTVARFFYRRGQWGKDIVFLHNNQL